MLVEGNRLTRPNTVENTQQSGFILQKPSQIQVDQEKTDYQKNSGVYP